MILYKIIKIENIGKKKKKNNINFNNIKIPQCEYFQYLLS